MGVRLVPAAAWEPLPVGSYWNGRFLSQRSTQSWAALRPRHLLCTFLCQDSSEPSRMSTEPPRLSGDAA